MPALVLATNVPRASIPDGFLKEASEMFQKAIGKPMQVCANKLSAFMCVCFHMTESVQLLTMFTAVSICSTSV